MKNRLKHWRHKFEMEREQFAEYLGVNYYQYTKWEANKVQPSLERLISLWQRIKERFPDTHLEDLLEY